MPGLLSPRAGAQSLLNLLKVTVSSSHAPKELHFTSHSISITSDERVTNHFPPALTINDLPPEILSEIFHTYLFWEDESDLIDPEVEGLISVIEPSSRSAPLLFCQVCSYWREVAISTPSLWSSIALKDTLQLDTVDLWLQRSRSYPLSFAVWLSSPPDRSADTVDKWVRWPELLDLLCREVHRWQDVLVHVPSITNMQLFMKALLPSKGQSPASILRTLDVSNFSFTEQMNEDNVNRLSSFPHNTLRRLTWEGYMSPKFQEIDVTMWQRLQQLTFTRVDTLTLFRFLEACPNVSSVYIGSLRVGVNTSSQINTVTAHKLEGLHIRGVGGDVTQALCCLTAPRLKTLSFKQPGRGYPGATDRLLAFLEQSQCRLTNLSALIFTGLFKGQEAQIMLTSKAISQIPNVSLRIPEDSCNLSFSQEVVSEACSGYSRSCMYAYHEPINGCYHLGWGYHDFIRDYARYPFIYKGCVPRPKWHVLLMEGPTAVA